MRKKHTLDIVDAHINDDGGILHTVGKRNGAVCGVMSCYATVIIDGEFYQCRRDVPVRFKKMKMMPA